MSRQWVQKEVMAAGKDMAEREGFELEGLLTRQRRLRNQYVADFARGACPLQSLEIPVAGSRDGSRSGDMPFEAIMYG